MSKIFQEFYCGECDGFITVRLNMSLNHIVEFVCPNCGHKHKRCITDGQIFENGREYGSVKEELCPPKSAYSKTPRTIAMTDKSYSARRDAAIIEEKIEEKIEEVKKPLFNSPWPFGSISRWMETYGGKR